MAPSAKSISLLFILTLSFFVQIHARESQFFSKVTNENNDAKETTTVDPNKEEFLTKHEQQPVFIPQTQNGYGLYGHESGQFPPSTTTTIPTPTTTIPTPTTTTSLTNVNAAPYTTTPTTTNNNNAPFKTVFEDDESLNKYLNSNQNYNYNPNPNNNNNNQNNEFYYNNNAYHASQNGLRDSRLTQRGGYTTLANQNNYNNNNNGANSYNNAERQGMSDTRFMENGKYYYDLNLENNYNPNRYENSRGVDSRNWNRQYNNYNNNNNNNNNNNRGYYGSNNNENTFEYNNSKEGYQNEEEFQESQDEFVP